MLLPKLLGQTVTWHRFYCLKSRIHNGWTAAASCQTSRPNPKSPQTGCSPKHTWPARHLDKPSTLPTRSAPRRLCLKTAPTPPKGESAESAGVKLLPIYCKINPSFKLQTPASSKPPSSSPFLRRKAAAHLGALQLTPLRRRTTPPVSQFVRHKRRTDGFYRNQTATRTEETRTNPSRGTGMPVAELKGRSRPQQVHFVPC